MGEIKMTLTHRDKREAFSEKVIKIAKDLREMADINDYTPSEFLSAFANVIVLQFLQKPESELRLFTETLHEAYKQNQCMLD